MSSLQLSPGARAAAISAWQMPEALSSSAGASLAPAQLAWTPDIPVDYVTVNGMRIRYITSGHGPVLVLLHALRTQLDMFQHVIPQLSKQFQVYALDYPGHGHSDAPEADYSAQFLSASVAAFLERLNIRNAIVAGESIGGTIALLLAAQRNPRMRGVVAVNPYDYARGAGLRRSSVFAKFFFLIRRIPWLSAMIRRVQPSIIKRIVKGGTVRKNALPPALLKDLFGNGRQPGHWRAFEQLVRHGLSWEQARAEYRNITLPVLLVYGDDDWSRETEREANRRTIPRARIRFIEKASHFLALDAPAAFQQAVIDYAASLDSYVVVPRRKRNWTDWPA
ncbi:MAG: alpha/beta fold hydrolase [Longimicrobiales bacterium]